MLDVDVPLEVAQYAEGQHIVASFVLSVVSDGEKKVPQYLVLLTESKDGLPFDYNQARLFTWNLKRDRYETADRRAAQRGVAGDYIEGKLRQGRRVACLYLARERRQREC